MKKNIKIIALLGISVSVGLSINGHLNKNTKVLAENPNYTINSFSEVPSDWSLYNLSDIEHTETKVENNELIITHTNDVDSAYNKYYGSVYLLNTDTYSDFTFEMEFSIQSYQNNSRYIGILWHTNVIDDYLNSLFMNYRINGQTAPSTIYGKGSFKDEVVKTMPVNLSDNAYHSLKITMKGENVSHYIDNSLIVSYNTSGRYSSDLLTESFPRNGKFGILVNKCAMRIRSINISDKVDETPETPEFVNDEELVSTYKMENNLLNFPTVVATINNNNDLEILKNNEVKPSNAILRMDKNKDIVDLNNTKIDSFKNIFSTVLKKEVIPIVRVETEEAANALISFLQNDIDILDMAVMSSKPELVKKVKLAKNRIRGIISFENSDNKLSDIVKTLNLNYATVAILSEEMASMENVYYIQARFKTVWVNLETETSEFATYNAINSGCYGIISANYLNVYNVYQNYDSTAYLHPIFNAAHRGLPESTHANSVSGVKLALGVGATHLELDCYLTTDNKVVIMHDREISYTTNGSGDIESYSLEELRQYKLVAKDENLPDDLPEEEIPILEDIIEAMNDSDAVLILEIKSAKTVIVQYIREIIEQYNFFDRIVFISFNSDIIGSLKNVIPECPTASLRTLSKSTFVENLIFMGQYNTIYDTGDLTGARELNEQYLRDRGFIGWYWTFKGAAQIEITIPTYGYVGITSDSADLYAKKIKFIRGVSITLEKDQEISQLETLKIEAETYDKTKQYLDGQIVSYEDKETYYNVICSYMSDERVDKTYYTQAFIVYKNVDVGPDINSGMSSPSYDDSSQGINSSTSMTSENVSTNTNSDETNGFEFNSLSIIFLSIASISIIFNIILIILIKSKKI